MLSEKDSRIDYISLSRNFGKECAMLAGFDYAKGDCMVIIDADLQDPPTLIPEMLKYWEDGYEDVYARRSNRGKESFMRKTLSLTFYHMLQSSSRINMLPNVGDFRLLDRKCIDAMKELREKERYTKGLFAWIGFKKKELLLILKHHLLELVNNNHFDYVIFVDEDCFINDFEALIDEFKIFTAKDYCIAGPQDGGVICHRNHSKMMINTFLSFWNIKLFREKNVTFDKIVSYINDKVKNHQEDMFADFYKNLKLNKSLFSVIDEMSNININATADYRRCHNSDEAPYCQTVRNDANNPIEPNQTPYSYDDNRATGNFEPYYIIEQALIMLTGCPIYYMFATDLRDDDFVKSNVKFDISGLTSAVYMRMPHNPMFSEHKLIAVHTWYSRAYTKWPTTPLQLEQTKRINTIIKEFSRI